MAFTDENLEKLKERLKWKIESKVYEIKMNHEEIEALLARLENAEHFVTKAVDAYPHLKESDVYKRWKESCEQ